MEILTRDRVRLPQPDARVNGGAGPLQTRLSRLRGRQTTIWPTCVPNEPQSAHCVLCTLTECRLRVNQNELMGPF
jgi:hypothetical protein